MTPYEQMMAERYLTQIYMITGIGVVVTILIVLALWVWWKRRK